jgi:hypothetical protein
MHNYKGKNYPMEEVCLQGFIIAAQVISSRPRPFLSNGQSPSEWDDLKEVSSPAHATPRLSVTITAAHLIPSTGTIRLVARQRQGGGTEGSLDLADLYRYSGD